MPLQFHVHIKQFVTGVMVTAMGMGSYVVATVTFNDFQAGTTIFAAEMNTKLNALKNAVNALEGIEECPSNTMDRFVDNGDGTICDSQTGLMWEKKFGIVGPPVNCGLLLCETEFYVNNIYSWTATLVSANGPLFRDFLADSNQLVTISGDGTTLDPSRTAYTDWRIPNVAELRTILLAPCPGGGTPCIDPIFGPTQATLYWTATSELAAEYNAWFVSFDTGIVAVADKHDAYPVRAVRAVRAGR